MNLASDYELALRLQNELNSVNHDIPTKKSKKGEASIIDADWEKLDPNPDIYVLFQTFDKKFFWGKLDCVEVKWSKRMYSCAGVCTYKGKRGGVCISLSLPLLQLRPRKDLVETLLHEMIHAYLFLTANKQDREEHGPLFHEHMHRINKAAGTKITVYHSFHDEVAHYKQHWWRCNGPCQTRKPFFGLVKRSMNRAPGPNDFWFAEHQSTCGGEFIKIKQPENYKPRKKKNASKDDSSSLNKYFPKEAEASSVPKSDNKKKDRSSRKKKVDSGNGDISKNITPLTNFFPKVPSSPISNSKRTDLVKGNSTEEVKKINPSNIHGFSSNSNSSLSSNGWGKLNGTDSNPKAGSGTGLKSNKGGTLIMNPRSTSSQNENQKLSSPDKPKVVPFTGTGYVLGGAADRSKSVLLSMFDKKTSEPSGSKKDGFSDPKDQNIQKNISSKSISDKQTSSKYKSVMIKNERENNAPSTSKFNNNRGGAVTSSSSGNKVERKEKLTDCSSPKMSSRDNRSTNSKVDSKEIQKNSSSIVLKKENSNVCTDEAPASKKVKNEESIVFKSDSDDDDDDDVLEKVVSCPVCGFQTLGSLMNEHLDECTGLETVLENVQIIDDDTDFDGPNQVRCPSCGYICLEEEINLHLDACLS